MKPGSRGPAALFVTSPSNSGCSANFPFLFFLLTAVRKRLVGVGAIPAIFPLCAIGREFSTAVLAASPPAAADSAESHSFEGAPNNHRDYQIPTPNGEAAGFVRAKMDVRRLSEDQGTGNSPTVGGKADWFVFRPCPVSSSASLTRFFF